MGLSFDTIRRRMSGMQIELLEKAALLMEECASSKDLKKQYKKLAKKLKKGKDLESQEQGLLSIGLIALAQAIRRDVENGGSELTIDNAETLESMAKDILSW